MYQLKTGAQMITYAECLKNGWQKQYERYTHRYTQHHPGVSALKQLSSKSLIAD
jgi:hypothetical protein